MLFTQAPSSATIVASFSTTTPPPPSPPLLLLAGSKPPSSGERESFGNPGCPKELPSNEIAERIVRDVRELLFSLYSSGAARERRDNE